MDNFIFGQTDFQALNSARFTYTYMHIVTNVMYICNLEAVHAFVPFTGIHQIGHEYLEFSTDRRRLAVDLLPCHSHEASESLSPAGLLLLYLYLSKYFACLVFAPVYTDHMT